MKSTLDSLIVFIASILSLFSVYHFAREGYSFWMVSLYSVFYVYIHIGIFNKNLRLPKSINKSKLFKIHSFIVLFLFWLSSVFGSIYFVSSISFSDKSYFFMPILIFMVFVSGSLISLVNDKTN